MRASKLSQMCKLYTRKRLRTAKGVEASNHTRSKVQSHSRHPDNLFQPPYTGPKLLGPEDKPPYNYFPHEVCTEVLCTRQVSSDKRENLAASCSNLFRMLQVRQCHRSLKHLFYDTEGDDFWSFL